MKRAVLVVRDGLRADIVTPELTPNLARLAGHTFSTASLVFGTSYPVFNRGGFQLVRCPLWVTSRRTAVPSIMSAFGGKADVNHSQPLGPLLAISGLLAEQVRDPG